jgi:phospholipid/cholesterol/gamma-HCH transport system permease protein
MGLSQIKRNFEAALEAVGGQGVVLAQGLGAICTGRMDGPELSKSLVRLGLHSIPVVILTALFVGGIMVVQSAPLLQRFGAESLLGWGAGFGIFREIGPVLTALMISGRVGSNNTAELGTLTVTDQVDGLRALAIDPAGYLIAPRILSIVVTNTLGTILSMLVALLGAALTGLLLLGVHPILFWNSLTGGLLGLSDVIHGLIKAVLFGLAIASSSTSFGLHAKGGAPGVGRAVNASVMTTAILIFVFDALVSFASTVGRP